MGTIEHVTGPCDLLVTAVFVDQASLARYLGFRLGTLDGVTAIRGHIATAVNTEGSRWRIDRFNAEHLAILQDGAGAPPTGGQRIEPDATDVAIMSALVEDCRMPAAELAKRTDLSSNTVQRRIARLEAARILVYRCGWPVSITFKGSAPATSIIQSTAVIAGMREVRVCATLAGRHNLLFIVWLRSFDDVSAFEAGLASRVPDVVLTERAVTLWPVKLGGHILDPQGRHLRHVPIAAWSDGLAAEAETAMLDRLHRA
jgi:DNA-binding Lrp family transcriptional regulator